MGLSSVFLPLFSFAVFLFAGLADGQRGSVQRGSAPCPSCSTAFLPVCGYSNSLGFSSYNSLCLLNAANACDGLDYVLEHNGGCTVQELSQVCKNNNDPVCGYSTSTNDLRTFTNLCRLNEYNNDNGGDYQYQYDGQCTTGVGNPFPGTGVCNLCTADYEPVCGLNTLSGYRSFSNQCEMDSENSCNGAGFVFQHVGLCTQAELLSFCNAGFCSSVSFNSFCAQSPTRGYQTFNNLCDMNQDNTCAGADWTFSHGGGCTATELNALCSGTYCTDPSQTFVCGLSRTQGYETFSDECSLREMNQCQGGDFRLVHQGTCTNQEVSGQCPLNCNNLRSFICARSPVLGYRTYTNRCHLDNDAGCNGGDHVFDHFGACTQQELDSNCRLQCTLEFKPVCAISPTVGQATIDNSCYWQVANGCAGADYVFDHFGVCNYDPSTVGGSSGQCDRTCTYSYAPVCVFDNNLNIFKTIPNDCQLRIAQNCDNQALTVAHDGACSLQEMGGACNFECPIEYLPVCTRNVNGYNTQANTCFQDRENICNLSGYTQVHDGRCSRAELGGVCNKFCTNDYSPVCAGSPTLGTRTFTNFCRLDQANSCSFQDWSVSRTGAC